ncbi:MAG TPA: hypothetical protein VEX62_02225 [Candidatus Limnocylindrales bacterium]|nr:hypothetical protein [Candidatus Limnocylindrales bacterium]
MPQLPRPLLIVLVVLVVLAALSCGAGFLNRGDQQQPPEAREAELREGGPADFLRRFAPPSEPLPLNASMVSSGCFQSPSSLQFSGSCTIVIPTAEPFRSRLLLRPNANMSMKVSLTHDGESTESDTETIGAGSDDGSVVLARGDSAAITLTCTFGCTVAVNPTPAP